MSEAVETTQATRQTMRQTARGARISRTANPPTTAPVSLNPAPVTRKIFTRGGYLQGKNRTA